MNKKVLVIVAHPDDETIWMGGTLLTNKNNWDITIISLCRKNDTDRTPKFKKVCEYYNARCFISDLDDSEGRDYKKITNGDIIERIRGFLKEDSNFDYIFTHGKNGEYEHIRHIEIHNAVNEMLNKKLLSAKQVFYFSYNKDKNTNICNINSTADKLIRLKNVFFNMKKRLVNEVYGFDKKSAEYNYCLKKEAFDTKK